MAEKKYHSVKVSSECYVSSSGHYHWDVWFRDNRGKRYSRTYGYGLWRPLEMAVPDYVIQTIEAEIARMMDAGEVVYHEYDRDGNKRFKGLRYYDADFVKNGIRPYLGKFI